MDKDRVLRNGECLYDYYINDDGKCPVLVIRDMAVNTDVPRQHRSYRLASNYIDKVIVEIQCKTGHNLKKIAAIYCDMFGNYSGFDFIGGKPKQYRLHPKSILSVEDAAIVAARIIHTQRQEQIAKIMSCLPLGRIEQFSYVELLFDDVGCSFWIPGYPSKEDVKRTGTYRKIYSENPTAEYIVIEVVSYLIHRKAAPASCKLMQALSEDDFKLAVCLDNVSVGDTNRYVEKQED